MNHDCFVFCWAYYSNWCFSCLMKNTSPLRVQMLKKIKNLQHKFLFLLVRDCWLSPFSISITLFLFFQPISSVSLVCLSKRFLQKHFAIQVFIFVTWTAGPKKTFIPQEPMYTRSLLTWFGLLRSTNRCGIYSPRLEYLSDCTHYVMDDELGHKNSKTEK